MLYSYRDELPDTLDGAWREARTSEGDGDEPRLVLCGLGREGVVATGDRLYVLRASWVDLGGGWQRASVHPLSDLAAAEVRQGMLTHRLRLGFHDGPEEQILVRPKDRDKMRVAARMLASMALSAKEHEREVLARQSAARGAAEAAAGRTDRAQARVDVLRPQGVGQGASAAPSDALELLKGLWHLVEVGALSEAEFQAKKTELLGRL